MIDYEKEIGHHFDIIRQCLYKNDEKGHKVLMATTPGSRYPYFYPRDGACATHLFNKLSGSHFSFADESFELLKGVASFTLHIQRDDGYWGQRYDPDGTDKGLYIQEDNVAHGMIILANYVLASLDRGEKIKSLKNITDAINKAALFALKNYFRREINLFFSTTSIHESAIERGYSLWVNFSYLRAFHLAEVIHEHIGKTNISKEILDFVPYFERNIHKLLIHNDRYIRRITPEGDYDYKPDITLMSPYYFGFHKENSKVLKNTIEFMANHLWDPELGMLQRYLPFTEDVHTHIHAGNGPWLQYTAMLARYYFRVGEAALADKILNEIDNYKTKEGFIPEHLSTYQRFEEFMALEWETGLDFDKEFYREIMVPNVPFDYILEELNNMKGSYGRIRERKKKQPHDKHIVFAVPLMWSHVEYAKALYTRMEVESHGTYWSRESSK
ncbi:MAG: hypothetical protein OEV42_06435 [Deltaproteobacteria bacterium]|nr:hypothetical protein [Deltaproteobacteria bacterium]